MNKNTDTDTVPGKSYTEFYNWLFWNRKLRKLFKKIDDESRRLYDLKQIDLEILFYLRYNPSASLGDISRSEGLNKAQVSMSVNDLKTKGYIDITESEKDKRYLIYRLTDKAEDLCETINTSHFKKCEACFSGFTEEEKDAFRILAKRISKNIDDFLEDKL